MFQVLKNGKVRQIYSTFKNRATCLLSYHNGIKPEINNRKIARKSPNTQRLNSTFLNHTGVKEEISRELKNILNQIKIKIQLIKISDMQKSSA